MLLSGANLSWFTAQFSKYCLMADIHCCSDHCPQTTCICLCWKKWIQHLIWRTVDRWWSQRNVPKVFLHLTGGENNALVLLKLLPVWQGLREGLFNPWAREGQGLKNWPPWRPSEVWHRTWWLCCALLIIPNLAHAITGNPGAGPGLNCSQELKSSAQVQADRYFTCRLLTVFKSLTWMTQHLPQLLPMPRQSHS